MGIYRYQHSENKRKKMELGVYLRGHNKAYIELVLRNSTLVPEQQYENTHQV